MAKSNSTANARTAPVDVMHPESLGVLAAWQGINKVLGGSYEGIDILPEGIVIRGLTMTSNFGVTAERVIADVNSRERRTHLWPTILYVNGISEPEDFADGGEVTLFGVQYFRNSGDNGSTGIPKYWKDAAAAYKANTPSITTRRRGPRLTRLNLRELDNLDPNVFNVADPDGLENLIKLAQASLSSRQAEAAVES